MLKYNLCFLKKGNQVLMLNRAKAPLLGIWNGVGGKLEPGETPEESMRREIREETGLEAPETLRFTGTVTWDVDGSYTGGMYVYVAEVPENTLRQTPLDTEEGILAWKPIDWVCDAENRGVAVHVKFFLPSMLEGGEPMEYRCAFRGERLLGVEPRPLHLQTSEKA
ncbi:NUDIX hydrolase [Paenibacillus silviterrae]|uniref:NUDIX hydrolase n=1 Tax=Paenibacillus silviterrae TaxID=3242194 RepID=UPI002542F407|nr:8-oxo-dGTP diphosphatase [Paenibacillus chinjuensis]